MAVRVQRQRTKGWRMPPGAVYVGRPSRWGNPYIIGAEIPLPDGVTPLRARPPTCVGDLQNLRPDRAVLDARHAVTLYRAILDANHDLASAARQQLGGRDLACWCPPGVPCHADVLLEIANAPVPENGD